MEKILTDFLRNGKKNFVFIGEAGSGKSEIAINFAINFTKIQDRPVHFFDMDQTKRCSAPGISVSALLRSR